MVIVNIAVVLPPVFVAVTVYVLSADTIVGVPLIVPFDESMTSPVGSAGNIDQDITVPPLEVGDNGLIAESFVKTSVFGLYIIVEGATSLT